MNTAGLSRGIDADRTVPGQVNAAEGAGSDEELACLAVNGEEAALFELVRRYKFLVMKKAEAWQGRQRDEAVFRGAERLLWAGLHYPEAAGVPFAEWAVSCLDETLADMKEMLASGGTACLHDENEPPARSGGAGTETDLDQLLNAVPAAVREEVWNAFSALEKRVFLLYNEGRSYQEMAEEMGRPVKSVDNALCRIKRKISLTVGQYR